MQSNILKRSHNFLIFNYVLDLTIFVEFLTQNESTNFLTEQCLQFIFGKNGCFCCFHSTGMLFGLFSFWQLSTTFCLIVSAGEVSSGNNRLTDVWSYFHLKAAHLRHVLSPLLSINCSIFPILHLVLGAFSLIWAIFSTIRFNLNSFRCDCPFLQISSNLSADSVCVLKSGFPSSSSIDVEFLQLKYEGDLVLLLL